MRSAAGGVSRAGRFSYRLAAKSLSKHKTRAVNLYCLHAKPQLPEIFDHDSRPVTCKRTCQPVGGIHALLLTSRHQPGEEVGHVIYLLHLPVAIVRVPDRAAGLHLDEFLGSLGRHERACESERRDARL